MKAGPFSYCVQSLGAIRPLVPRPLHRPPAGKAVQPPEPNGARLPALLQLTRVGDGETAAADRPDDAYEGAVPSSVLDIA